MSSFLFQLHELQDRNAECLGMLHESQEEVKMLRSRASSVACLCHPQACGAFPVVTNTTAMVYTYWHKWCGVNRCYRCCSGNHFVKGKGAEVFQFFKVYIFENFIFSKLIIHLLFYDIRMAFPFYMTFILNTGINMFSCLSSVVLIYC